MATLRQLIDDEVARLETELAAIKHAAQAAVDNKQSEIDAVKARAEHFEHWLEQEVEAAAVSIRGFFARHGIGFGHEPPLSSVPPVALPEPKPPEQAVDKP